jgi:signal transduction histidine kinase
MSLREKLGISRFERRILIAIFLSGLAPFLISMIYVAQVVEASSALSTHLMVRGQLESAVAFYKEFFDAKKREFAARAEAISKDAVLIRAAGSGSSDDVLARLEQILADNADVRLLRVLDREGEPIAEAEGGPERQREEFAPKLLSLPLGVGSSPRIDIEFILPAHYIADRDRAEEIATFYDTAIKSAAELRRTNLYTYAFLTGLVLLGAVAIGYVIARQVTKRVGGLAHATERVAKGDLDFAVKLGGDDEITELTAAFNRMIAEVKDARDRIVYLEKVSGWQEFARRLAHEIKNPLTPIQLAIQEIRRRAPEGAPEYRRVVEDAAMMVEEEIAALTRLVDEFSQFARLPEVVPDKLELRQFIEEFLAAYNRFEPDAVVEFLPGEPEVPAAVDRVLMRRVLANLATNAIQAAGPGRAKLWLSCRTFPSGEVEIRIEDNGPGVPAELGERIFDPYFTTKAEGTGLGLAIVKKIVLQHGGTISLEPGVHGPGAAFVIILPPPDRVLGR